MTRITVVEPAAATAEQMALFDAVQTQLGMVPNFLKVFANSPVALRAFLGLFGVATSGSLDAATRERIALALAQQNGCQYCVSAHTTLATNAGLSTEEIGLARAGTSGDAKAAAAVRFAKTLMDSKGEVSNADLMTVRAAGHSEAEIVEIITHVGMNFLTNVMGKASRVEIDFPKIDLRTAA